MRKRILNKQGTVCTAKIKSRPRLFLLFRSSATTSAVFAFVVGAGMVARLPGPGTAPPR